MCIRDRHLGQIVGGLIQVGKAQVLAHALERVCRTECFPVSYTHLDVYKRQAQQLLDKVRHRDAYKGDRPRKGGDAGRQQAG